MLAAGAAVLHLLAEDMLGAWAPLVKMTPVAVLAGLVFLAPPNRPRRVAALGLAISALADAVIEWSFLGGLATFLVAHLLYIAAFVMVEPRLRLVRLLPVALWAVAALPVLVTHAGGLAVPVLVYGIVIFTMIWRAAAAVQGTGWSAGMIGLAGAVLFGLSDTLLGYAKFVGPLPASDVLIMGTYWGGQALLTASFLKRA